MCLLGFDARVVVGVGRHHRQTLPWTARPPRPTSPRGPVPENWSRTTCSIGVSLLFTPTFGAGGGGWVRRRDDRARELSRRHRGQPRPRRGCQRAAGHGPPAVRRTREGWWSGLGPVARHERRR